MMKNLTATQLQSLLTDVEEALQSSLTKAQVVRTLSDAGECSPNSTGIEKSFLKCLKAKNVVLTPLFAELMGEEVPGPAATAEPQSPEEESKSAPIILVNPRATAYFSTNENQVTAVSRDGRFVTGSLREGSQLESELKTLSLSVQE